VRGYGARAVDVVPVWPDLARPGPVVQVCAGGELVEAAILENGAEEGREEGVRGGAWWLDGTLDDESSRGLWEQRG
jgi:hypothetical protein